MAGLSTRTPGQWYSPMVGASQMQVHAPVKCGVTPERSGCDRGATTMIGRIWTSEIAMGMRPHQDIQSKPYRVDEVLVEVLSVVEVVLQA